ncbi:sigma-54-dependent transcriptional regulator [Thiocapsa sp. UBA6158]|jgi:DNA-binding NtrC family response regulator|uniref:sigma-54-dependent transcriptional regulator n=1 Tax=Thiocapsa sp. UBA6158 TaxID=1947692 RepID=UPI0025ED36F5|nr:sigma-54 dependent transcriptional regulator [Thiocapsa sp. UBA6158]
MVEALNDRLPDLSGLSLLLVDDDPGILRSLQHALTGLGACVTGVGSLREARQVLAETTPDALLVDLRLKDGVGLDLLPEYLARGPDAAFYVITDHGSVPHAVDALKQGVRHYFEKPADPLELARRLTADLAGKRARDDLAERLAPYLWFRDPVMVDALLELPRFALSAEPVLIEGRTGTGKELVARALHGLGSRAQGSFVAVNCGAIPETMLEAELFGHEKGAFTGATRLHRGRFEQAHEGTLFLDEIGEMTPASQVSLLRVLETGAVQRLGAERDIAVDVRVVAATHRPLEEWGESGLFRQDLLYRINVLPLRLPNLCEHPKDIGLLAERFLANGLRDMGWAGAAPKLNPEALTLLERYRWPGNVRELRNLMARLAVRLPPGMREIGPRLLQPVLPGYAVEPRQTGDGVFVPKGTRLADAEWLLIQAALMESGHNRARAAKALGIGERTLRRKLNGG